MLNKAKSDNPDTRNWATYTLGELYRLNILRSGWTDKFATVLWSQRDAFGFPAHTDNYRRFAFLILPHPKNIDPISLFKKYIKNTELPIQKTGAVESVSISGGDVPFCYEIIGACKFLQWTEKEVIAILKLLVEWWDADKVYLKKYEKVSPFGVPNEFKTRFSALVAVLVHVVAPSLSQEAEIEVRNTLHRLLLELRDNGLAVLRAEAACIHIYPNSKREIMIRIEEALASSHYESTIDGVRAVMEIVQRTDLSVNEQDLSHLLSMLGQMVRWRKKVGLPIALNTVAQLIRIRPSLITNDFEALVLVGLLDIAADTGLTDGVSNLDFSEKLEIRQEAAGLAYALFEHSSKRNKSTSVAIEAWRVICHSDNEFAEIKNKWIQKDCLSYVPNSK